MVRVWMVRVWVVAAIPLPDAKKAQVGREGV
jgi:hypothetical protein